MDNETLVRVEINCLTGETEVLPLTADEIAQMEADAIEWQARRAEEELAAAEKAKVKASAEAKLAALGLTAEEIAAL